MSLIAELEVRDFRTMRELSLELGPVCALVGEAQAGKSNVLSALRSVVDPQAAPATADDVRHGASDLALRATLATGERLTLHGRPPHLAVGGDGARPPVEFLPASERTGGVEGVAAIDAVHRWCHERRRGVLLLVEDPELYLRPQAQRYFSRLLRRFASLGNQVVYSTHAPAFLNVARMDELVFVERREAAGTKALRPPPLTPDEDFRVLSEFDAERAELFLAKAAILVEGETEKLALPFVFAALGEDADRESISIVECGGKGNIVLFARVCKAAGIPFVIIHDRDARPGRPPSATDRATHERLREIAGREHTIELAPDFEAVSHLQSGGSRKPERAWRSFARLPADRMPGDLVRAVRLALHLARGDGTFRALHK